MKRPVGVFVRFAVAAGILASPVAVAATAHAGPYGSTPIVVSSSHPAAGGQVQVTASGFGANSSAQITIHSTPVLLASVTADANGSISSAVTVPSGFVAGSTHQIVVAGTNPAGAPLSEAVTITLAGGTGSLPFTGMDVATAAAAGAALVGFGGFLAFAARWKRRAGNTA